ncbi:cobalamin biosynthesis protein [Pseudonocardia sp. NPDC049635]|uniref:cobalamin biosynthesis protein n=1 Tax=Pseudonocardia sp. NPDC049635 TaxID=3155506 RepID=UPI003400230E
MRDGARAAGLMIGILADTAFGDPRRGHPVAAFGSLATRLERRLYRDSRAAGAAYTAVLVGGTVAVGALAARTGGPVTRTVVTAASTWAVLGGTSLVREGGALAAELAADDLPAARRRVPHLCARDPALLDSGGMARAGVESLAENTSDAVVGPLVWGALAGVPGLLGYRAVNTLDAMVGYRSARYERFGCAAARLDDLVNLVPSRVTALLTVALAPLVGGSPRAALRAWRRDAAAHPSPNAGPVEATAAGALGLRLGGPTTYAHGTENRPTLGDGRRPGPADLARAARLSRLVAATAGVLAVGVALVAARPGASGSGAAADGPGQRVTPPWG